MNGEEMNGEQMNKQDIKRILEQRTHADFISINDIKKSLSIGLRKGKLLLAGLEYYVEGKRQLYVISDVSQRIYSRRVL